MPNTIPFVEYRVPFTYRAVATNSLAYFLVANVTTGVVNLAMDTTRVNACLAVLVLCGYMLLLHGFAILTYTKDIKLKIW